MEHTHDGYCNTQGNSHYLTLVIVIQTLACIHDHSSIPVTHVTRTALINGGHPWTVQKLADEVVKISAAERKSCRRSRDTARGFELRKTRVHEVPLDEQMDPYQARGRIQPVCSHNIVLFFYYT